MDTIPDPEVRERPTRRRFGAAYKVAILDELDQATVDVSSRYVPGWMVAHRESAILLTRVQ